MTGRVALVVLALAAASAPARGGIIFREVETVDGGAAGGSTRQVRQVFADGDSCKAVIEESGDPLYPPGSYVLATVSDAFIVDPATKTVAPVAPAAMDPVMPPGEDEDQPAPASGVTLERQVDEAGPVMLGLQTRHYVYRLRYQQGIIHSGKLQVTAARMEERHEFWLTPVPQGESAPVAWQALRAADDGGRGVARREVRDAIETMYGGGFVIRQVIERPGSSPAPGADTEHVVREVTAFSRKALAPAMFEKPAGYSQSEYLAPQSGETATPPGGTGDAPAEPAASHPGPPES